MCLVCPRRMRRVHDLVSEPAQPPGCPDESLLKGTKMNRLAIAFLLFLSACATTQGTSRLVSIPQPTVLAQFSKLTVKVEAAKDIPLGTVDKERISNLIIQHIKTDSPERFVAINQDVLTPAALLASVRITKYDEGNAFARAMLAGLGQMHIDAEIILNDVEKKEEIARYEVNKTFAWGGLYGGFTGMKDVEDGFAKAVASSILGKSD